MDSFGISNTRSRHNDTDYVFLSATVGANPPVFVQKSMGDVNNGNHSVGLSVEVDIPDDDTPVVFSYLIMNSGHQGDNTPPRRPRRRRCPQIAKEIIHAQGDHGRAPSPSARSWCRSSFPRLPRSPAMLAVVEVGLLIFADCDGLVAAGAIPFTGADLIRRTSAGQKISNNTDHPGVDSPDGCGSNSHYHPACTIATSLRSNCLGSARRVGKRRGRRTVRFGDRQFDLDRHVRPASPHGDRPGSQRFGNLGQFSRRQDLHGRPSRPQYHHVVEQFELDQSRVDPDRVRLEWPVDEWRRPRPKNHGARQLDLGRHVGDETSDGVRDRPQRFGNFGEFSGRQDLYGRTSGARDDPLVEQLDLDQVRNVGHQTSLCTDDGEPLFRSPAGIPGHHWKGHADGGDDKGGRSCAQSCNDRGALKRIRQSEIHGLADRGRQDLQNT